MKVGEYIFLWAALLLAKLIEAFVLFWTLEAIIVPYVVASLILLHWNVSDLPNAAFELACRLLETMDDISELLHWFDRWPQIGAKTPSGWELVAVTRSSNNGYGSQQFRPVIICDYNALDDPFWPSHVASVYNLEVRERSDAWSTIIIWQVSLLNGGQKKTCHVDVRYEGVDWFGYKHNCCRYARSFQSDGIIFVAIDRIVLICDTRYGIAAHYQLNWRRRCWCSTTLVSISCCRRIWSEDGGEKPIGWLFRLLRAKISREAHDGGEMEDHWRRRVVLRKTIYEVYLDDDWDDDDLINSEEEIVFGSFHQPPRLRPVRTARALGVYAEEKHTGDGPTMLFDHVDENFVYCFNFDELLQLDDEFADYIDAPTPTNEQYETDDLRPVFLSDRECIECSEDGSVYRYEFEPSTLKFLAAKQLFRSSPGLRTRMSAHEFQRLTGIEDMKAHFAR